jgi:hypothetical protein
MSAPKVIVLPSDTNQYASLASQTSTLFPRPPAGVPILIALPLGNITYGAYSSGLSFITDLSGSDRILGIQNNASNGVYMVNIYSDIDVDANGEEISISIANRLNGVWTQITESITYGFADKNGDEINLSTGYLVRLNNGDAIGMFGTSITGLGDVVLNNVKISIYKVG